jgi:hypothetical protein
MEHGLPTYKPLGQKGVIKKIFEELQKQGLMSINVELLALDSTTAKVHPNGAGAAKKTDRSPSGNPKAVGRQRFIWLPRMSETL